MQINPVEYLLRIKNKRVAKSIGDDTTPWFKVWCTSSSVVD